MVFWHRKKKLAAALVAACIAVFSATAFAEQPKAEEYRVLFRSGNFCVKYGVGVISRYTLVSGTEGASNKICTAEKYKMGDVFIITAGNNNKRMKGIYGKGDFIVGFNGDFIKKIIKKKTAPDVLYKEGKYYRVDSETVERGQGIFAYKEAKSTAIMLSEESLGSSSLDINEGWGHIRKDLALPEELAVFCWNDSYRDEAGLTEAPHFIGNAKHTVNEKIYDCDDYVIDKKAVSGKILSQDVWRTFYEGGNLVYVQRLLVHDGKEELVSMIDIREISANVPAELFELPKGTLVYAADEGKMYDLTEQGLLIEKIGEKPGEKTKAIGKDLDEE